jgi:endonuclease/exonuclease/phosphatase family metal-dependent hydrolase
MKRFFTLSFIAALVTASSVFAGGSEGSNKSITLMAYNIENLFDITHDEGKDDFTYLPLAVKNASKEAMDFCKAQKIPKFREECFTLNWDENTLNKKIQNMSKVIRSFNNGAGPDILVVEEVENLNVLTQLRDKGLKDLGYKTVVLIEGPDKRGVDVGLISRFPLVNSKIHVIDMGSKQTRPILEVTLNVYGKLVTVFGNHWASQMNPDADRVLAAQTLLSATQQLTHSNVIAAGDFNTSDDDTENGLRDIILNEVTNPHYADSRLVNQKPSSVPGSHCYHGEWAYLDKILTLAKTDSDISQAEFSVYAPSFILQENTKSKKLEPFRFDAKSGEGYSDHMPITLSFKL